jgi:hypothetical protein
MATQIQLRRDTAANWTSNNPILAEGETGIETDSLGTSNVLKKIGNGIDDWNTLPYESTGGGGGSVNSVTGDGVGGTATDVVMTFPDTSEVSETTDKNYVNDSEKTKINSSVNSTTTGEPSGSDVVLNTVSLTQAEYDAGTPISTTFYIIKDA